MINIKKATILITLLMAHGYAMQDEQTFSRHTDESLFVFKNNLVAFKLLGIIEKTQAEYITGSEDIGFGIVTEEGEKNYLLHILINKESSRYITNAFRLLSFDETIDVRKATAQEKELVKKAIRHNGARFWGKKTDGDSLQLLEFSK